MISILLRRIKYWFSAAQREEALRAEMELHIEEKATELRDEGWSERDARAEARRRFGNFGLKQQASREIWIARYWSDFWQDMRYGARKLIAQPGFTLAAVLALVLGIAVNAILFNVFNALALAPWAVRDAKQAVQVLADRGTTGKGRFGGFSWPHFRYLRDNTQTLDGMTAFTWVGTRVRRGDAVWNTSAVAASENYFAVLGTGFAAGRGFSEQTRSIHDPAPEVVLHYDTWMGRFGGDTGIVGEWLELSGHQVQVVGIAAPGFSGATPNRPNMWIPGAWRDRFDPTAKTIDDPDACCISVIGRLKPGVRRASAQAELNTLGAQFLSSVKRDPKGVLLTDPTFLANPSTFNRASPIFLVMGVAALLILLLACANVANMQLARATARHREMAVRLSLGASRGRLVRQLLAESLLVSGIAGTVSVAISAWAPGWIVLSVVSPRESLAFRFANDGRVLVFIFGATVATALLFGLAPALGAARTAGALRDGVRATSSGRLRSILLAAQVALCAILVSGTALLVRALDRARNSDVGFRYEQVIVMSTGLDASGATDQQASGLLTPLVERMSGLPGVESVAYATVVPLGNVVNNTSVTDPRTKERVIVGINEISASFFTTLRIPLVAGRAFTTADESRENVAIVNEAAAERLWPEESPLGKMLTLSPPREVIAVVRNSSTRAVGSEREPYVWVASKGRRDSRLLIRHAGDAGPLLVELPKHSRDMDQRFLASAAPYSDTIAAALRSADVSAAIAGVLGVLSMILACVGIYGVAAYNVSQRTREVGVRMALGAQPRAILAMILQQNLRAVLVGAAVGIVGAISFGRLLTSLLYGLTPADPIAILATIVILFGISAFATWGPARRAARVDPAITLRHE